MFSFFLEETKCSFSSISVWSRKCGYWFLAGKDQNRKVEKLPVIFITPPHLSVKVFCFFVCRHATRSKLLKYQGEKRVLKFFAFVLLIFLVLSPSFCQRKLESSDKHRQCSIMGKLLKGVHLFTTSFFSSFSFTNKTQSILSFGSLVLPSLAFLYLTFLFSPTPHCPSVDKAFNTPLVLHPSTHTHTHTTPKLHPPPKKRQPFIQHFSATSHPWKIVGT